jgi:uncharacterized paraquat-inducible protein A
MFPGKCNDCSGEISVFFIMEKGGKIKSKVCPRCKEKLEKEGWKATGCGMY